MPTTKLVDIPASSATQEIVELGYLESYDAVLNDDYAFGAYKETDKSDGSWRVRIKARHLTGVVFEPEAMRLQARSAARRASPSSPGATASIRRPATAGASSTACT
ncbi:MAG: hypothetical protein QM783_06425 [Phycisphaerales bacterium]